MQTVAQNHAVCHVLSLKLSAITDTPPLLNHSVSWWEEDVSVVLSSWYRAQQIQLESEPELHHCYGIAGTADSTDSTQRLLLPLLGTVNTVSTPQHLPRSRPSLIDAGNPFKLI